MNVAHVDVVDARVLLARLVALGTGRALLVPDLVLEMSPALGPLGGRYADRHAEDDDDTYGNEDEGSKEDGHSRTRVTQEIVFVSVFIGMRRLFGRRTRRVVGSAVGKAGRRRRTRQGHRAGFHLPWWNH
ncbi:hypothetical protein MRX96_020199 [Rhipicephalus microplus]